MRMPKASGLDVLSRLRAAGQTMPLVMLTTSDDERDFIASLSEFTPRERQILRHLAEGRSNKAIGRELGISDGTVKLHVKAILRKPGVHSWMETAVIAVEENLRACHY